MDVSSTPAAALDAQVTRSLQPPAAFECAARRALGDLGWALQEHRGHPGAAAPWSVLKIIKVGAWGDRAGVVAS